jgi:hypothetical protein
MHTESADLAPPPARHCASPAAGQGVGDDCDDDRAEPRSRSRLPAPLQALVDAFEPTGGVVTEDAAVGILRKSSPEPASVLAQSIDERRVVHFSCGDATLLPVFQFDLVRGCLRPGIVDVIAELAPALDDGEIAQWFARPNAWLNERAPVQAQVDNLPAVVQAARSDRFVMLG